MNLHPLTVILLLALAFLFYSQGELFFFFSTLAIGFLLLVVSLSNSSGSSSHSEKHGSSIYPEKMEIKISGDGHKEGGDGQKEMSESIGGAIDFTGKLFGKVFGMAKADAVKAEKKKKEGIKQSECLQCSQLT